MKFFLFILIAVISTSCCKENINDSFSGRYRCLNTKVRFVTPLGSVPYYDTIFYVNFQEVKKSKDSIVRVGYSFDSFKSINFELDFVKINDSIFEHPRYYLGTFGKVYNDSFLTQSTNLSGSAGTGKIYEFFNCTCKKIRKL